MKEKKVKELIQNGEKIYFVGPNIDEGPMPAIFYFCISAKQTLTTSPFNQFTQALNLNKMRLFSIDLPEHIDLESAKKAIDLWAKKSQKEPSYLSYFINSWKTIIVTLIEKNHISSLAFCGLSRGSYFAIKLCAEIEFSSYLVNFSPLIDFSKVEEFASIDTTPLSLTPSISSLLKKEIKMYCGSNDMRIETKALLDFYKKLIDLARKEQNRYPKIELILYPSIGSQGHGTPKEIFTDGAKWIEKKLLMTSSSSQEN